MAFGGTIVITQIADNIVRISGATLAATTSGTIGLFGATGSAPDIRLPESFEPKPYTYSDNAALALSDMIEITANAPGASGQTMIGVVKTGTTVADWRTTVLNTFGSASGVIEFYVKYHT